MIKKIKSIKNMAVFKDFDWDKSVKDIDGRPQIFKDINIIYGRNYSGKTTLSRIFKSFEDKDLPDKYENPSFVLVDDQGNEFNNSNLINSGLNIRVFNDDFIKENLKFVINPDDKVNSFAVLGEKNTIIEKEISDLAVKLGSEDQNNRSGLYKKLEDAEKDYSIKKKAFENKQSQLDKALEKKAISRDIGIKYNSEKFGDQNYNITKLNSDIKYVSSSQYQAIDNKDVNKLETLLVEKSLKEVSINYNSPQYQLSKIFVRAKELIIKDVVKTEKIDELVKDALKNNWVKQGIVVHNKDHSKCSFCGSEISSVRWEELTKHFDEESSKYEKNIEDIIKEIDDEIVANKDILKYDKIQFYNEFHSELDTLFSEYRNSLKIYIDSLNSLKDQLEIKKKNIFMNLEFKNVTDNSKNLTSIWEKFDEIKKNSNKYTASLDTEKNKARDTLRFHEVYTYLKEINYAESIKEISDLKGLSEKSDNTVRTIKTEIDNIISQIKAKRDLLKDEGNGAKKVNQFLNDFFGNQFLSLQVIEEKTLDNSKNVYFDIFRDGKKAYNLSEGEISLLAFCYFIAKLEDISTKNTKPIIWIDDPISSLDGNHIFFVYSLLFAEIIKTEKFSQLFISTHNLEFLKYLKRISHKNQSGKDFEKIYLLVERIDKESTLKLMPKYMKEYVTEFNYLFEQIYKCSQIGTIDDSNYTFFYNFANNARKFLEIYLYYKFPSCKEDDADNRFEKFFGKGNVPKILTERLNNEYSHLAGCFERGSKPIEEPEMKSVAQLICNTIRAKDSDQYNSLVESIS